MGVAEVLRRAGLAGGEPLGRVLAERVEADALAAADHVQEQVGGDPVQPALERAGGVGGQRSEDPDEDLLGEILGVVLVARQTVGEPVDAGAVRLDDLLPGGRSPGLRVGALGEGREGGGLGEGREGGGLGGTGGRRLGGGLVQVGVRRLVHHGLRRTGRRGAAGVPPHGDVALGHTSSVGSSAQQGHHHIHLTRQARIKVPGSSPVPGP